MASRQVICGDGVAWAAAQTFGPEVAIVTSLPDHSELPLLGFDGWKAWFRETAATLCRSGAGVVIFYQTDVKHQGAWVDKAHLVSCGADDAGAACLWHRIVCRVPAGQTTFGRPAYAHLLAFSRSLRLLPGQSSADVLPELGEMPWARAMGAAACQSVTRFLLQHTPCRVVVDPFCGQGTMLAVANAAGLDAVGVELSAKRAAKARALELPLRGGVV